MIKWGMQSGETTNQGDATVPYENVGSCDGICPTRGTRCSPCPQESTEDNRTPITLGMRVYNYYDGEWVEVVRMPREFDRGWFQVENERGGRYSLNGARVSTKAP